MSRKISWSDSTVSSPVTRCHVVCAFGVTIDRCSPISWLSSVDFPAFGRPMSAT